jgi:hypothetical protein
LESQRTRRRIFPATYGIASQDSSGRYHGTHFSVSAPQGWQRTEASGSLSSAELLVKRIPVTQANPGIILLAADAPSNVPVEALADIDRQHEQSSGNIAGDPHATVIAGQGAQTYTFTESNGNIGWKIIAVRGGVTFTIELVSPAGQQGIAHEALDLVVASWRWE